MVALLTALFLCLSTADGCLLQLYCSNIKRIRIYSNNPKKIVFQIPSACTDKVNGSVIELTDGSNPQASLTVRVSPGLEVGSYYCVEPLAVEGADNEVTSNDIVEEAASICCYCNPTDPIAARTMITKQLIPTYAFNCIRGINTSLFVSL